MATTQAPLTTAAAPDTAASAPIRIPAWAWVVVALALLQITYAFVGQNVLPDVWNHMHEFFHDGRHFLGIACH